MSKSDTDLSPKASMIKKKDKINKKVEETGQKGNNL